MCGFFVFQAEDGIRDLVRSRGLGDVYKRQVRADFLGAVLEVHRELAARIEPSLRIALPMDKTLSLIHI